MIHFTGMRFLISESNIKDKERVCQTEKVVWNLKNSLAI